MSRWLVVFIGFCLFCSAVVGAGEVGAVEPEDEAEDGDNGNAEFGEPGVEAFHDYHFDSVGFYGDGDADDEFLEWGFETGLSELEFVTAREAVDSYLETFLGDGLDVDGPWDRDVFYSDVTPGGSDEAVVGRVLALYGSHIFVSGGEGGWAVDEVGSSIDRRQLVWAFGDGVVSAVSGGGYSFDPGEIRVRSLVESLFRYEDGKNGPSIPITVIDGVADRYNSRCLKD